MGWSLDRRPSPVVTLGLGSFPEGLKRRVFFTNFPKQEMNTTVAWQESQQNFVVTGARYPGISDGLRRRSKGTWWIGTAGGGAQRAQPLSVVRQPSGTALSGAGAERFGSSAGLTDCCK